MNSPLISLIAALSENRVIGNKGEIPWHIPGEQKRFKEITLGHPVIMGRKTFESIGRVLPGRTNIIITSDETYHSEGTLIVHSLAEAINRAKELDESEIFIIGGGKVFEESISFADKLYLTVIHQTIEGDTFFPDYSAFKKVVYEEQKTVGEYTFSYLDLVKE